jgi:hypothetical protein
MDLQYQQVEAHLLNATYWVYDLYNTPDGKDNWNLENLSLLGPNRSLRHPDILARPYPMRSSAEPEMVFFDIATKQAAVALRGAIVSSHPTVIFVPQATQYPAGIDVRATGTTVEFDVQRQLLYWWPNPSAPTNQLVLSPCGRFNITAFPAAWQPVLAALPVKTDPPVCAQIRADIAAIRAQIRDLEAQKAGLNPRDPVDMMEIRDINNQINALQAQIAQLQQNAQAAGCFCW